MMKKNFKKILAVPAFLTAIFMAVVITGCADPNGLHNQAAAMITFEFTNFPESLNGEWVVCGNFNNWDNSKSNIKFTKGNGSTEPIAIGLMNIEFSLVPVNSWTRSWYGDVKGNGADKGSSGAPMQNFYIDGLDLSAGEITLVIDGSSGNAEPIVK